jgi:hypothetical protein
MLHFVQLMIAKRFLFSLALFLSFAAIGNAAILEPLHDVKNPKAFSHTAEAGADESQCCFICHPIHHQWFANWPVSGLYPHTISTAYHDQVINFHLDPPLGSIFRPPLAF